MPPEVVKAATVRFELGLEPDLVDDDDSDDDTGFEDRPQKNVVWAQGVATKDGNSAQRLHEVAHLFLIIMFWPSLRCLNFEAVTVFVCAFFSRQNAA